MNLEVFAPAKINLGLAVTGKRSDGYHTLDTVFTKLTVGDTLSFETISHGVELEVIGPPLPAGPDNLVYRAAQAYLDAINHPHGVAIQLKKRLPLAAGLGGGSSDAAATLLALSALFAPIPNLFGLAVKLGADVPFFLEDGARRARGIGEVFEPVSLPETHLVLANPGVGISAKEAYVGLNGRFGPELDVPKIIASLERLEPPPYRNDLEISVLEAYPVVNEVKRALEFAGLFGVLMSGSGSTCFGLARSEAHALEAAAQVRQSHPDWWVVATSTRP